MRDGEFGKRLTKEAVNHGPEATRMPTTGLKPGASQGPRSGPCLSLCLEKPEACLGLLRVRGGAGTGSLTCYFNNFEEIQFTYKHVTHPAKMLSYLSIICLSNSVVFVLFTELHNHHHCLILDHFHHCIKQKETRYPFAVTPQPLPSNHQPTFCPCRFPVPDISCEWNHALCGLL